jgi:glyoxylase-like metal-dependent hydrolase (beta-lactamase superfamily II)
MFERLPHLDAAWRELSSGVRMEAVRGAARHVRERILRSGQATSVRTFFNAAIPYPTKFAFAGAARSPAPFVTMENRCNLVQFRSGDRTCTLLFNPTDHRLSQETPFFKDLRKRFGEFLSEKMARRGGQPLDHVAAAGLRPEDIDYVAFDHLHTQDLRGLFGGQLPNAKLLITPSELATFERLHPLQVPWYIRDALVGIQPERIVLLDGDTLLGDGVALVRTPGHTEGNMSLVLNTGSGIWAISENGVACDSYAPLASRIPGIRAAAKRRGVEFILNANTLEHVQNQYVSMALERELVDRVADAPDFYQHLSSSELARAPLSPLLAPTYAHGGLAHGAVERPRGP